MSTKKTTLRNFVADSTSFLEAIFDRFPEESAKDIHNGAAWQFQSDISSEAFRTLCIEVGFMYLLCFLDNASSVFGETPWFAFFSRHVSANACIFLKKFSMDSANTIWDNFLERLNAFGESVKKFNQSYSNWSTTYSHIAARKLEPFIGNGEFPAWLAISRFYGIAMTQTVKPFSDFCAQYEIVVDDEDRQMLAKDGQE
jgi:hypothetical protein